MTTTFINNVADFKECNTLSFYSFLKNNLTTTISKIQDSIIIDKNVQDDIILKNEILSDPDMQYLYENLYKEYDENEYKLSEESVEDKIAELYTKIDETIISLEFKDFLNNLIYNNTQLVFKNINYFDNYQENSCFTIELYIPYEIPNLIKKKKKRDSIIKAKRGYIYYGDIPFLTNQSTFFINNAEHLIINQLTRCSGIYLNEPNTFPSLTIISSKGASTTIRFRSNDFLFLPYKDSVEFKCDNLLNKNFSIFEKIYCINTDTENETLLLDHFHIGKLGRTKVNKLLNINFPITEEFISIKDIYCAYNLLIDNNQFFYEDQSFINFQNRELKTLDSVFTDIITNNFENYKKIIAIEYLELIGNDIDKDIAAEILKEILNEVSSLALNHSAFQFADHINLLSLLSQNRRLTVFGPAGIEKDMIPKHINDIQLEQYGRICPIETVDGLNAGLITSLSLLSRFNELNEIEEPFSLENNTNFNNISSLLFLPFSEEKNFFISFNSKHADSNYLFAKKDIFFHKIIKNQLNFSFVSPLQLFSLSVALIPFLDHNDLGRIQMAASMEKQAVPLMFSQKSNVGTGIEENIALSSGYTIKAYFEGIITKVSTLSIDCIDSYNQKLIYPLTKNNRLNQKSLFYFKPLVWLGEKIFNSQVIANGPGINSGEFALGYNLTVAYIPWEGYNYEDGILISERLITDDCLTSASLLEYDISYDIFDEYFYTSKCMKTTTKPYSWIANEKIIEVRHILNLNARNYEQFELRNNTLRVYTVKLKPIQVGDKLAGRYGNKGVITKIISTLEMPYTKNGFYIDLLFNPLGLPSRLNVGQLFESLLAYTSKLIGKKYKIVPFSEFWEKNVSETILIQKTKKVASFKNLNWFYNKNLLGKFVLRDSQLGTYYDNSVTIGQNYILKLIHLVSEKYHSRSVSSYTGIFHQPTIGKQKDGGQRFGEMETWALEAHGSFFTLQEFLTLKSDNLKNQMELKDYNSNFLSDSVSLASLTYSTSFFSFIRELNSIGLVLHLGTLTK